MYKINNRDLNKVKIVHNKLLSYLTQKDSVMQKTEISFCYVQKDLYWCKQLATKEKVN